MKIENIFLRYDNIINKEVYYIIVLLFMSFIKILII